MDLPSVLTVSVVPSSVLSEAAMALLVAGDLADPRPDVLPGSVSPGVLPSSLVSPVVYKDIYANVFASPHDLRGETPPKKPVKKDCRQIVRARCPNCETNVIKVIYCGKEWCPECGHDWSVVHQRRFSRLLPKARQMGCMGQLVIEFPDAYRKIPGWTYSKNGLRRISDKVVDVLGGARSGKGHKRSGGHFSRGFMRWHWFGDKTGKKFNPHLNVVVDGGFLQEWQIGVIKADLRGALFCPTLIVNYSYKKSVGEMIHTLKYITRPTFHDESWSLHVAGMIRGFRNVRSWGRWQDSPVWSSPGQEVYLAVEALERGNCPDCGSKMVWRRKPFNVHYLELWQEMGISTPLGGGFFKVRFPVCDEGPPTDLPADVKQRLARLQLVQMARAMDSLAAHKREVMVKDEWQREMRWCDGEEYR